MGIIKAAINSVKGTFSDQYIDAISPSNMDNSTLMCVGVSAKQNDKNNTNRPTPGVITDGSVIYVGENMTMLLVDGGKVIDYSAEAGYFQVHNDSAPSLFNGQFGEVLQDAFQRVKFGGTTPQNMQVVYINTQEIRDIPFGTPNPINYFDNFYNAELYVRAFGYFSIRVTNPLLFYSEMVPRNAAVLTKDALQQSCLSEFLTGFQTAIGTLSAQGERISHLSAKTMELSKQMQQVLESDWDKRRGMAIESVGISSLSYDEQSRKLIDIRNQGAMLSDPTIRDGYVQGAAARGIEAAGSNANGSTAGFMGVNMGMQTAGGVVSSAGQINATQAQQAPASPQSADMWVCPKCGNQQVGGNFCQKCGEKRPATGSAGFCQECGAQLTPGAKFCGSCGKPVAQ